MYEYMKNVRVQSVGVGCVIDENGRKLRMIGNMPVKEGDMVWTDGHIAYGHRPVKEQVHLPIGVSGVPFIHLPFGGDNLEQGYYTDSVVKKLKQIGDAAGYSFLVNDNRKLFLDKKQNRDIVDAEILTDENDVPIGYSIATVNKDEDVCSANNSKILIENSMGTRSDNIAIKNVNFAKAIAEDFFAMADAEDYKYNSYITQLLYFRFNDKKGNWEMAVGVTVNGLSFYHSGLPESKGRPLFHYYKELTAREIISRTSFIGGTDIAYCKETVTIISDHTGYDDPDYPDYYWDGASRAFGVVKYDSAGNIEIIHRNYNKISSTAYAIVDWAGETETDTDLPDQWQGPYNALPIGTKMSEVYDSWWEKTGTQSYYVSYGGLSTDEDITGWPQVGLVSWISSTINTTDYNPVHQNTTFPGISKRNDITVDLPDGFTATLKSTFGNSYTSLSVNYGNTPIISDYSWHLPCQLDLSRGLIYGGAVLYHWSFPHICCYKFPNSDKTLASVFMDSLKMCENGNYTNLGRNARNLRLRRMRKIRKATQNQ